MPRVTTKGQVTIPKEIRDALGIEPGDEVDFERVGSEYRLQKRAPTTEEGDDPFEKHRGSADGDETMPERMRRLRGEYPRKTDETSETDARSDDEPTGADS
jgi:AbrB family looped-hinge helix DNA binding protein